MDILVVGDCHGGVPEVAEKARKADVILAVGDVCGDSAEMRDAMFASMDSEKEWYDILGREKAKKAVNKSLEEGEKVLEKLNSFEKPVFVVPGNWDWNGRQNSWNFINDNKFQKLVEKFSNIHNINREVFMDSNYSYIGYGPCSGPEVPQYDDDKPETDEELEEIKKEYEDTRNEIKELFENAEKPVIFLSHNVPHRTSLDEIKNPDSPADGRHYGSIVVRDMIEEFQPFLSIAGHMHEGYGTEEIDSSLCINAGLNSFVKIEVDDKIKLEFYPSIEYY